MIFALTAAMTNLFLEQRDRQPEWMDQPDLDPLMHDHALNGLARVNAWSTSVQSIWNVLKSEFDSQRQRPLRILDLASGGGDTAIRLAQRAQQAGKVVEIVGCDISATAIGHANQAASQAGVSNCRFIERDVLNEPLPDGFDIVMCSLFLHHLDQQSAETLLRNMAAATSRMVMIDDMLRSPTHYALAWLGCRLLTRSPIVHKDGPLSVCAALKLDEVHALAKRTGLEGASVRRHWPFRFLLTWRKQS